jgi:hypothetical protein
MPQADYSACGFFLVLRCAVTAHYIHTLHDDITHPHLTIKKTWIKLFNDLLPQVIITLINYTLNIIFTGSAKVILTKYFNLIVDLKSQLLNQTLVRIK